MTAPEWQLHPQLEQDCLQIGDLPLCRALLMNDANFPWLILVPRRVGAAEIIDLGERCRGQLITEIAEVSAVLRRITRCDKLNVAALGNAVPQLHVHVIARFHKDAAWPRPIWGQVPPRPYVSAEAQRLIDAVRRELTFI